MNRRGFVFGAATAAALVPTGAAGAGNRWTDARVQAILAQIRASMARASESVRTRVPPRSADQKELLDAVADAAPIAIGYGAFHDLPLVAQVHPDMQTLIHEVVDGLASSVARIRKAVAAMGDGALEVIDDMFRADPGPLERVFARATALTREDGNGPVQVRFEAAKEDLRGKLDRHGVARTVGDLCDRYDRLEALVARHGAAATPRPHARDEARVARAQAYWMSAGVEAAPAREGGGANAAGIVFGALMIVAGVICVFAAIGGFVGACVCVGIGFLILAIVLLAFGIPIFARGVDPRGTRKPKRKHDAAEEPPAKDEASPAD